MGCNSFNFTTSNCTNVNIGLDYTKAFTYRDENGTGIDLSGYDLNMRIRKSSTSTDILTLGIVVDPLVTGFYFTDIASGQFTMRITDTDTSLIPSGSYVYDIIITNPSGDTSIFMEGNIQFTVGKIS